jgi:hypothetical protein
MSGHFAPRRAHPGFQSLHQRHDALLAHGEALLCRQAVDAALDVEDGIDPPHRLDGKRCACNLGQLEELPPPMCPTGRLGDRSRLARRRIELIESGIGISLQDAVISSQMLVRMLAGSITRVEEHRGRRRRSGEWPVVTHVGP